MLKNKIAIYCRVSSDEQAERGTIENQRIFAEKYIDLHQLTVHDYYMDDGVTGTLPIQERPAGKRLLDDARDGKFNLVLFYKLDRLGRATRVILNAVAELKKYGVDIRSMTEPFDTSTPSGQFTLTMFAGIAELDRENILARMRQGAINSATKGKWMGGAPPYGYKLVDGYLAYDDEPIEGLPYSPKDVALMIFELCVKDKISTYQIADKLNAMGIPPRYRLLKRKGTYTGKWFPTKVADILHNKVYFGEHVFGGMSKRKDKVEIMQSCPAIVTRDTWEQAQKCLEQNYYRPTSKKQRTYLLRGLVKCAHCGATYCGTTPSSRGQNTSYYACYNKTRYYPADTAFQRCSSRNIRADWLEALVWQDCMRYIMQPDTILEEINADDSLNKIKAEIEALKTNLSKLEQARKTAVNLCIKGIINEDDLAEQLKEIDNGIANIKTAMADNDALLDNADASPTVDKLNKIKNRLAENELDEREKQIIIQELVKEIIITSPPDDSNDIKLGVEIKYRFGATKNDSEFNPLSQGFAAHTRLKRAGKAILARTRDMLTTPSSNG